MAEHDNGVSVTTVLLSFIAGAAVGAGMALLYAPKAGKELRGNIRDLTDDAIDKIKEYTAEAQEKIKATIEDGKDLFKEKKTILSAAVEAGKEAMEKEREKFRSTEA
ncbi:MAG: YtxH domain-containing protein [Desulfuromonadia bacterium]